MKTPTVLGVFTILFLSSPSSSWVLPTLPIAPTSRVSPLFGWGPDPIWSQSPVSKLSVVNTDPDLASLSITFDRAQEFTNGGQYVQVKPNADSDDSLAYLAIRNSPAEAKETKSLTFLVKKSDSTEYLFQNSIPKPLTVSQPMGGGFPVKDALDPYKSDFPVSQVLLVCTGTGVSPILSLISSGDLEIGGGRSCKMYWGLSSRSEYSDGVLEEVRSAGVTAVPVYSNPVQNERVGYVQNALEEDGISVPRNTLVVMVGQRGMADAVKEIAKGANVQEDRVVSNF